MSSKFTSSSVVFALALACSTTACSSGSGRTIGSSRPRCPAGTIEVSNHCIVPNAERCPEGFDWDSKLSACVFICPDAAVDLDAEPSPFCTLDAGVSDGAE